MSYTDKYNSIIDYLKQCPQIANNPTFFNFAETQDNNKQILITANDKATERPFVDGSVMKRFTFTIIDYRSVIYQALVNPTTIGTSVITASNENVDEILDVQAIIDWINDQNELQNFPDFGSTCMVESISTRTDNPNLNGVDTNVKPAIAKYHVAIVIDYIDNSKTIWNKEE